MSKNLLRGSSWAGQFRYYFYSQQEEEEGQQEEGIAEESKEAEAEDEGVKDKDEIKKDVAGTVEENEQEEEEDGDGSDEEDDSSEEDDDNGILCGVEGDRTNPYHVIIGPDHLEYIIKSLHSCHTETNWDSAWIREIGCYHTPVSSLIDAGHRFVLLKIQYGDIDYLFDDIDPTFHWLSIEKFDEFIEIQWAPDQKTLENFILGEPRPKPVKVVCELRPLERNCVRGAAELIKHLVEIMKEQQNPYNLLIRNCQHFAEVIYKFCTGIENDPGIVQRRLIGSWRHRPLGGPQATFECRLRLESSLPLPNLQGDTVEVTIMEFTDEKRIFGKNTGVYATIYSYEDRLEVFLDHKDKLVKVVCQLVGPNVEDEAVVVDQGNNNTAGDGRSLSCILADEESYENDDVLVRSVEYQDAANPNDRELMIVISQAECGKTNHFFGCTKCRSCLEVRINEEGRITALESESPADPLAQLGDLILSNPNRDVESPFDRMYNTALDRYAQEIVDAVPEDQMVDFILGAMGMTRENVGDPKAYDKGGDAEP